MKVDVILKLLSVKVHACDSILGKKPPEVPSKYIEGKRRAYLEVIDILERHRGVIKE